MKKDFELKTERLVIKPLVIKPLGVHYLETVDEYARDYENTKYMQYLPNETLEETRDFLLDCDKMWETEDCQIYECAILLNDMQIGAVSLYIEEGVAEFGWIINKKFWGNGYTVEAAEVLRDYAINVLGIKHFIAHCDAENKGSYRVMEKLGMRFVEKTSGRKNRTTPVGEEREELIYKLDILL